MAFSDGTHVAHMPFSCDHKPVFDGNTGPNTGGMGAYSPPTWLPDATAEAIRRDVTEAAIRAMAAEGVPFKGVLYPGLMSPVHRLNYVDGRLTAPKSWRDVYHYDADGNCTGWTRYDGRKAADFTPEGHLVLERDAQGRCVRAQSMRYERQQGDGGPTLVGVSGGQVFQYEYSSASDRKGRIVKTEPTSKPN